MDITEQTSRPRLVFSRTSTHLVTASKEGTEEHIQQTRSADKIRIDQGRRIHLGSTDGAIQSKGSDQKHESIIRSESTEI